MPKVFIWNQTEKSPSGDPSHIQYASKKRTNWDVSKKKNGNLFFFDFSTHNV
jgi:hypothetical protein